MKQYSVILLSLPLLLIACSPPVRDSEYSRLVHNVRQEARKPIVAQGYECCGGAGGAAGEICYIDDVYLSYCDRFTTIEEARHFIVEKMEMSLQAINAYRAGRTRLHHFPYEAADLSICFYFKNEDYTYPEPPYLSRVSTSAGEVIYERWNAAKQKNDIIYRESYEVALNIHRSDPKEKP